MAIRNKHGMLRSAEVMKSQPEQAPELHHMRVHPANEKGVIKVTHHAGPTVPAHETHNFGPEEHDALVDHMLEHAGNAYNSEGGGDHYGAEAEGE